MHNKTYKNTLCNSFVIAYVVSKKLASTDSPSILSEHAWCEVSILFVHVFAQLSAHLLQTPANSNNASSAVGFYMDGVVKYNLLDKLWVIPLQNSVPFFWLFSFESCTFTYDVSIQERSVALHHWVRHMSNEW
jgi:hypothetical protein